jgi:hypothetical protein
MYNVTFRRVRVTIVGVEKKYYTFWVCVCSFSYPAGKAHAPYSHLWPVWLCHIFPHYLINGTIFRKKLLNIKCVFGFSLQSLSETFLILRTIQRDIIINVNRFSCKVPVILAEFEWEFSRQILEKCSNIKFHEHPSSGRRFVGIGRIDMKLLIAFSQLCERA